MDKVKSARQEFEEILPNDEFNRFLREFGEREIETASQYIEEGKSLLSKIIVIDFDGGNVHPSVLAGFADGFGKNADDKEKILTGFGVKLFEDKVQPLALFLISEVWISHQTKVSPSNDQDHEEGIIISGRTIDGRDNFAMAMIKNENGERKLDQMTYHEYGDKGHYETESYLLQYVFRGYAIGVIKKYGDQIQKTK
jgi:hypothetical protein